MGETRNNCRASGRGRTDDNAVPMRFRVRTCAFLFALGLRRVTHTHTHALTQSCSRAKFYHVSVYVVFGELVNVAYTVHVTATRRCSCWDSWFSFSTYIQHTACVWCFPDDEELSESASYLPNLTIEYQRHGHYRRAKLGIMLGLVNVRS